MQQQGNKYVEETLFVVRSHGRTRLPIPEDLVTLPAEDQKALETSLELGRAQGQRLLFLVSGDLLKDTLVLLRQRGGSAAGTRFGIVAFTADPAKSWMELGDAPEVLEILPLTATSLETSFALRRAARYLALAEHRAGLSRSVRTLDRLNEIFLELSKERSAQRLLAEVLVQALTLAEAREGSLFMVEDKDGATYFRLRISSQGKQQVTFAQIMDRASDTALAGWVAMNGKPVHTIVDPTKGRTFGGPAFSPGIDHKTDRQVQAVLTVPLKNPQGEVVAVLQLVDKKTDTGVVGTSPGTFDGDDESVIASFATQAAICMENVDLYNDIQRLFEGFVKASIAAIESRDPSTGGHSERVARICVGLAKATTECNIGVYRSVRFRDEEIRELEYAALLHDFGKIGVREEVLVKAKKLYPYQLEVISERFRLAKASARIEAMDKRLRRGASELEAERECQERLRVLEAYWQTVREANEPTMLKKENRAQLDVIRQERFRAPDGITMELLSDIELQALCVTRGSLTQSERLEIESHVRHTYQFLKMIPWTKGFKNLTEIAYAHHEKLDGTGYPRGLLAHEIPLQSKIMTIADIYDALTAADRWYKEAVPVEKAIEILRQETAQGKLDPELMELFVEKKIFELTHPKAAGHKVA